MNGVSPGIIIWPEDDLNKEFMSADLVESYPEKKGEPSASLAHVIS